MRRAALLMLLSPVLLAGCNPVYWVGIRFVYDKSSLPAERITMNVPYDGTAPGDHKRQLDVFWPDGRDWPTVIFIHGGGWAWGDRSQTFYGVDAYRNIGRFFASQGYGAAIPSYRLLWTTDWRSQATDVARAVAWVQANIAAHGGNPRAIFLMGHSAGAQLAMRVATEPQWLDRVGGRPRDICGVVAISGAGYDMEDDVTRALDEDKTYFVQRFAGVKEDPAKPETVAWRREASVLPSIDATDPPFLLMMAARDHASLYRQVTLALERLQPLGLAKDIVVVPRVDHRRIVLELSRTRGVAGPTILQFLRDTPCPRN